MVFSGWKSKAPRLPPSAPSSARKGHLEGPWPPAAWGLGALGGDRREESGVLWGKGGAHRRARRERHPCGCKLVSERPEGLEANTQVFFHCPFLIGSRRKTPAPGLRVVSSLYFLRNNGITPRLCETVLLPTVSETTRTLASCPKTHSKIFMFTAIKAKQGRRDVFFFTGREFLMGPSSLFCGSSPVSRSLSW